MSPIPFTPEELEWWRTTEFDVTRNCLYLDHAAMSPLPKRVERAVTNFHRWRAEHGSRFDMWWQMTESVRKQIGSLIGASPDCIAYVQNTSSGLNLVAQGLSYPPGSNVIICDMEFPSNIYPWLNLESKGVEVRWLKARGGRVGLPDLEALMDEQTVVVSLSHVESGNGFKNDLRAISQRCKHNGTLFVVDAIQGLGVQPVDVRTMGIDVLVSGFFKWLFGPDGVAFVYCSDEVLQQIKPVYVSWAGMENKFNYTDLTFRLDATARKFETGNLNFSAIQGVHRALEMVLEIGVEKIQYQTMSLTKQVIEGVSGIPGVRSLSDFPEENRSQIVLVDCPNSQLVHQRLKEQNIFVNHRNGLRISPHFYNTSEDVTRFLEALEQSIQEVPTV